MNQHTISSQQKTTDERECAFHGCHADGDNTVYGVPLCFEHFLRYRVRVNLSRLAA